MMLQQQFRNFRSDFDENLSDSHDFFENHFVSKRCVKTLHFSRNIFSQIIISISRKKCFGIIPYSYPDRIPHFEPRSTDNLGDTTLAVKPDFARQASATHLSFCLTFKRPISCEGDLVNFRRMRSENHASIDMLRDFSLSFDQP